MPKQIVGWSSRISSAGQEFSSVINILRYTAGLNFAHLSSFNNFLYRILVTLFQTFLIMNIIPVSFADVISKSSFNGLKFSYYMLVVYQIIGVMIRAFSFILYVQRGKIIELLLNKRYSLSQFTFVNSKRESLDEPDNILTAYLQEELKCSETSKEILVSLNKRANKSIKDEVLHLTRINYITYFNNLILLYLLISSTALPTLLVLGKYYSVSHNTDPLIKDQGLNSNAEKAISQIEQTIFENSVLKQYLSFKFKIVNNIIPDPLRMCLSYAAVSLVALTENSQIYVMPILAAIIAASLAQQMQQSIIYAKLLLLPEIIQLNYRFHTRLSQKFCKKLITLLLHSRDTLIAVRYIMSSIQMAVFVFDTTTILLNIFSICSLLTNQVNPGDLIFMITSFIKICTGLYIIRSAYEKLHSVAKMLRSVIEEHGIKVPNEIIKVYEFKHSAESIRMQTEASSAEETFSNSIIGFSEIDKISVGRLSEEICNLWPTDWLTPSHKSSLSLVMQTLTIGVSFHRMYKNTTFRTCENCV